MRLTVVLGASGEASFDIILNDNDFVRKWVDELRWCLDNCPFDQLEIFSNFKTADELFISINESCTVINSYINEFIVTNDHCTQEYLNYLHEKFEQLSGGFNTPTRLFSLANKELKTAIRNLNLYIHKLEQINDNIHLCQIAFDKDTCRRHKLDSIDYKHFEFKVPAGTVYLHYNELGKNLVDIYKDGLSIDYPGLKNLHYYSGNIAITFTDVNLFEDNLFSDWLTTNNIDPYDKSLGHGKLPLGMVENINNVKELLLSNQYLKEIIIKE